MKDLSLLFTKRKLMVFTVRPDTSRTKERWHFSSNKKTQEEKKKGEERKKRVMKGGDLG